MNRTLQSHFEPQPITALNRQTSLFYAPFKLPQNLFMLSRPSPRTLSVGPVGSASQDRPAGTRGAPAAPGAEARQPAEAFRPAGAGLGPAFSARIRDLEAHYFHGGVESFEVF